MLTIKLLIAEDHKMLRNELRDILERIDKSFEVIGLAENGKQAIDITLKERPEVIIMDIDMPVMDGIEATKKIMELSSDVGIIGFSMSAERWKVLDMVQAGAKGYLLKNSGKNELQAAIKSVYQGNSYFCKEVQKWITPEGR